MHIDWTEIAVSAGAGNTTAAAAAAVQIGKLVAAPGTAAAAHNHPIDSLQPHPRSTP